MTCSIAIQLNDVSKAYKMYKSTYDRIREALSPRRRGFSHDFYALKNITLNIRQGESVGIVGRNGSGKSTLLQIVCGTLQPTLGSVSVNGKVTALLELGSGFNPECTGRQNIYMNAAILGFKKKEIHELYDGIVAFADIGEFIDQPVKTYSTGMYVRLAFAVAISVNPDILVVDEALAVGDEAFQRKCFSRILDLREKGKTFLLVSHGAQSIIELCDRAILLDRGEILLEGNPKDVISRYQKLIYAPADQVESIRNELICESRGGEDSCTSRDERFKEAAEVKAEDERDFFDPNLVSESRLEYASRGAIISNVRITTLSGRTVNVLCSGKDYCYTYDVRFTEDARYVRFGSMIKTISGFEVGGVLSHSQENLIPFIARGRVVSPMLRFRCSLTPGVYFMNAGVTAFAGDDGEIYLHRILDAMALRVLPESNLQVTGFVDFSARGQSNVILSA
jgi:lipopolysaccharide transport system ATP-binding protein